jgi:hypothetical protein
MAQQDVSIRQFKKQKVVSRPNALPLSDRPGNYNLAFAGNRRRH